MRTLTRRTAMSACAALACSAGRPAAAAMEELGAAAAKKGPVIWYEGTPPEQVARVAAAFNKTYPRIQIQYVRNTGGNSLAAKVI